MKLAVKLSLTLGVLFCCIATVGLFGLYQMNKINAIATDISQTHLPSIINIQGLNILTSTFRRYETEHIHSKTPTIMLFYERKMQQVREAIDARLEVYKNSLATAEEKELYQSIVTRWNHYLTLSTEATMLSKALQTHEAIFLLDNESLRQYQIMVSTLVKAAELDVSMGKEASQAGTALYTDATRLVMFMLIATLLLAAGLGGYLVRDTLRTLGKDPSDLGALARRIADGDLDVQTDERAVGVYADMLVMVDNLRQHL
ncbi:MAG: MCP four helix bundle domain-containing protein, partial [Bilophila sp.]